MVKALPSITCATCEQPFQGTKQQRGRAAEGRKVFCSRACQQAGHLVTVICAACEREIQREAHRVRQGTTGRFFCSNECRNEVGAKPRTGRNIPCAACSADVWVVPVLDDGTPRTCSINCKNVWQRRDQQSRACEQCGTEFSVRPSDTDRFCSRSCYVDAGRAQPGQRTINGDGYALIWVDDNGTMRKVREHRHFMEQLLGRALRRTEEVHHRNGHRADNKVDGKLRLNDRGNLVSGNLELWSTSQPAGQEIGPKLDWALELLETYRDVLSDLERKRLVALAEQA